MNDLEPRFSADQVSHQATGRDSAERSGAEPFRGRSTEVVARRAKRRFSAAEKLRIIAEADQCKKHGDLGALLRREGIYSSQIATWRRQKLKDGPSGLAEKKRGRKPGVVNPLAKQLAEAERQNRSLTKKLAQAETIIDFQKKFLALFGETPDTASDERKS